MKTKKRIAERIKRVPKRLVFSRISYGNICFGNIITSLYYDLDGLALYKET
jgi:hypothetical protein